MRLAVVSVLIAALGSGGCGNAMQTYGLQSPGPSAASLPVNAAALSCASETTTTTLFANDSASSLSSTVGTSPVRAAIDQECQWQQGTRLNTASTEPQGRPWMSGTTGSAR